MCVMEESIRQITLLSRVIRNKLLIFLPNMVINPELKRRLHYTTLDRRMSHVELTTSTI